MNVVTLVDDNTEWRDIEGFEGLYQISNNGEVRSPKM